MSPTFTVRKRNIFTLSLFCFSFLLALTPNAQQITKNFGNDLISSVEYAHSQSHAEKELRMFDLPMADLAVVNLKAMDRATEVHPTLKKASTKVDNFSMPAFPNATAAVAVETLPAGTLIIAMDDALQGGSSTTLRRAYGLAVRLLHAGIPLKWIIDPNKTSRTATDLSASARQRYPSIGSYATRNFRTGPLAIFPGFEAQAAAVINSYGNNIRVYELQSATQADINTNLTHKPFVFVESGENPDIHTGILSAAGLSSGTHYTSGRLTTVTASSCVTIITVPHNDDITTAQINAVKAFTRDGGNFFAQCAAVRAFQGNSNRLFTNAGFRDEPGINPFLYDNPQEPSAQFEGTIPDEGGSLEDFGFNTEPPSGTRIVHDNSNDYKAYTGRIDGVTKPQGGYIHYLGGHDHDGDIDSDRFYLNAVLRSALRPTSCNLNLGPLAQDDTGTIDNCGGSTTVTVLANDTNPLGTTSSLTVSLPNGGTGAHGTFVLNANKTVTYTLTDDFFSGTDQITYRICDGSICDDGVITITSSDARKIGGTVFIDANNNGTKQSTEGGQNNVTVRLYTDTNGNGQLDNGEPQVATQNTANGGTYNFNITSTPNFGQTVTISNRAISSSTDDSYQEKNDDNKPTSVEDKDIKFRGYRFPNLNIPANATITSATLTVVGYDKGGESATIRAEDNKTPGTYSSSDNYLSSRSTTSQSRSWSIPEGDNDNVIVSPDFSNVVQQVVSNRSGVTHLSLIVNNSTEEDLELWNFDDGNASRIPKLNLTYTIPGNPERYIVVVDPNTFPAGATLTTDNVEAAVFTAVGQIDCDNNFGLRLPTIDAVNDDFRSTPTAKGGTTPTVFTNDNANGTSPATDALLTTPTIVNNGGMNNVTINSAGIITVPANTPGGDYTVRYRICLQAATSVCDEANVLIRVPRTIDAVNDNFLSTTIPSTGGTTPTVFTNDVADGVSPATDALLRTPTIVNNGGLTGASINSAGVITVPANTLAGDYTVRYRICLEADGTICDEADVLIRVACPIFATPTASVTVQPTCAVPSGTIVFTAPTTGVQYSINGTTYQSSPTFSGVAPGTYTLSVRSTTATTCITTGGTVTVNAVPAPPATPVASVTVQPTCAVPTGTIVFTAPTTGVQYSINGTTYQSSPTFSGVAPGTYTLSVRSTGDNTCITTGGTVTVNAVPAPPATPVASVTVQPTCAVPTGTIVFTAPTTGVQYSINGTTYQGSPTFSGVASGTYTLSVRSTGDNTCITTGGTVTVNAVPNAPVTPVASVTVQPTCAVPTGTIVFTAPTTGVQYSINGATYQSSPMFSGVASGTYTLRVRSTGDNTCITTGGTVTVNAVPAPPATPVASVTVQPTCAVPTGTIVFTAPTTGVQYSINGTTYQSSSTFSGVASGTYTLRVRSTGDNTCIATGGTVTVNAVPAPPAKPVASVNCSAGFGQAVLTITAPLGSNLQYSINNGSTYQSSNVFTNVSNGSKQIRVRNTATSCVSEVTTVSVDCGCVNAPTLNLSSASGNTCGTSPITINGNTFGGSATNVTITENGAGTVTPTSSSNSTFSFTYTPAAGDIGNTVIITVTTNNPSGAPCEAAIATYELSVDALPATPVASVTVQPTCAVPTGTIVFTAPTTGVQYSINGTTYQSTSTFSDVAPGTYTLRVRSTSNATCITSGGTVTVNAVPAPPATPVASVTVQPTCAVPSGTIVFTAPTTGVQYSINGTTYQSSPTFSGVAPGIYTLSVRRTGDNTCITTGGTVTVNAVPAPPATPVASVTVQPTCAVPTGTIVFTAPTTGVQYSINGTTYQSSPTFSGVAPGTYTLSVRSTGDNTCITTGGTVTVNAVPNAPATPVGSVTVQPTCAVPTGTIVFTAPTTGVQYSINGTTYQGSPTFSGVASGTYTLSVRSTTSTTCVTTGGAVTVNAVPDAPVTPVASVTVQPTCAVSTGTIVFTATTTGVQYSINGIDYQNSPTFSGVTLGAYTLSVRSTSNNTCVTTGGTVTVNAVSAPPATPVASVTVQPTCAVPSGTIVFTAPTTGVQYSIDGTNYQDSPTFSSITPGNYLLRVRSTNDNTCITTGGSVTVGAIPLPPATPVGSVTVQPSCATPTGTIVFTVPPTGVQYSIGGAYQNSPTFTGIDPGTYTLSVRRSADNTCVTAGGILTVNAPPVAPILSTNARTNVCPAETVNLNSITSSNIPSGLTRTWHTGTPATNANKVTGTAAGAGTYYAAFFDATNNCYGPTSVVVTVTITTCCPIITNNVNQNSNPTTCLGSEGSIIICGLVPGKSGYSISYTKNGSAVSPVNFTANGSGCYAIPNLGAGTYSSIVVTHPIDCPSGSNSLGPITLTDPVSPTIGKGNTQNTSACGAADGFIQITGLISGQTYLLTYDKNGQGQTPITFISSGTTYTIQGLTSGDYTDIKVENSNCESNMLSHTIVDPFTPVINISGKTDPTLCSANDGTFTVSGMAPGTYTLFYQKDGFQQTPISFTLANGNTSYTVRGLTRGTYTNVRVVTNGCVSNNANVSLSDPGAPVISLGTPVQPSACGFADGSIIITGLTDGVTYKLRYRKDGIFQTPITFVARGASYTLENLPAAIYSNIFVDQGGCRSNSLTQVLQDPGGATIAVASTSIPTVCGANDGSITISGLSNGLQYILNYVYNGVQQSSTTFTASGTTYVLASLTAGSYTGINVTQGGCKSNSVNLILNNPDGPSIGAEVIDAKTCTPGNDGAIIVTGLAQGISYTLTYKKNGVAQSPISLTNITSTSYIINGLTTGVYSEIKVNQGGCVSNEEAVEVTGPIQPPAPNVPNTLTNDCPAVTADLTSLVPTNNPGLALNWHSGTPATSSNRIPVPEDVGAGTYHAAYFNSLTNCYGPTAPVVVTIVSCIFPPIAINDIAVTPVNTPVTANVLVNDSDPQGSPLTVTTTPVSDPSNGTVTLGPNGNYTYTPTTGFIGEDTFCYEITNGVGLKDTACVVIDVLPNLGPNNNPPVAVDDNTETTLGTPVDIVILANDADPDDPNTPNGTLGSPVKLTDPVNGAVVFNANGTITYTPAAGFVGMDSLTYRICDNGTPFLCDEATVRILVKPTPVVGNQPPVAVDDAEVTSANTPVSNTVATNDSDPDNTLAQLTFTKLTDPTNGTVTFGNDGSYTYTPTNGFIGNDSYTYQVCDPSNACDVATVQIAVLDLQIVALLPKVWLQGALYGVTGTNTTMRDNLRSKGLIPLSSPYPAMGMAEVTASVPTTSNVLNAATPINNAIVDWVYIELRDNNDPTIILNTTSALIQRDGDIVATDGISPVVFKQMFSGNYHVTIKHRNHLGVMSAAPIALTAIPAVVDFRDGSTVAYNLAANNVTNVPMVTVDQGLALWAGNTLYDNRVIYQGNSNDVNPIYQLVLNDVNNIFGLAQYKLKTYNNGDVDMNGETIFQGTGNDLEFIYQNIIKNHPGNILNQNFFIIKEQIP